MLVPISRQKFDQLVPLIATGPQYSYCWGKLSDLLNRLLVSVLGIVIVWLVRLFLGHSFDAIALILGVIFGLYWLWGPIFWASQRNRKLRKYKYSGFWQGRVLDVYVTDELTGEESDVTSKGELVIIENRERRLNLEVGDETGFKVTLQAPLKRIYKKIARNQPAQMLLLSNRPDLSRVEKFTDIYLPRQNLWVSDYPYLQRNNFTDLSKRIAKRVARDEDDREFQRRQVYTSTPNSERKRRRQYREY